LEFVKKAAKIAPTNDGTWRYSEFYVLIRLSKNIEALQSLDNILKTTFLNEIDTINQIVTYNTICLKEDLNHIQSDFIIGAIIYKKLDLPLPDYEKLESFINACGDNENWKPLKVRAQQYLDEINKSIGIKVSTN